MGVYFGAQFTNICWFGQTNVANLFLIADYLCNFAANKVVK